MTAVHEAVLNNDRHLLMECINSSLDLESLDKDGETPLHKAISGDNFTMVKLLVDAGVCVNSTDSAGMTVLELACLHGGVDIVLYLLKHGSEIKTQTPDWAPLYSVILRGDCDLVKILVENGADIEERFHDQTALCTAVTMGDLEIAEYLVKKGACIGSVDSLGYGALYEAAIRGHLSIVKLLVENGADIHVGHRSLILKSDQIPQIIVDWKEANPTKVILDILQQIEAPFWHGVDLNALSDSLVTGAICPSGPPFEFIFYNSDSIEWETRDFYSYFLQIVNDSIGENGGTLIYKSDQVKNPVSCVLYEVASEGYWQVVDYFLEKGADINALSALGGTSLHQAIKASNLAVIKGLVERGADVNMRNGFGETPLYIAVSAEDLDSVRYLVNSGAEVNACNRLDGTALNKALEEGQTSIADYLIENGADMNGANFS